jgi:hypothetical protein
VPDPTVPLIGRGDLDRFLTAARGGDLEHMMAARMDPKAVS